MTGKSQTYTTTHFITVDTIKHTNLTCSLSLWFRCFCCGGSTGEIHWQQVTAKLKFFLELIFQEKCLWSIQFSPATCYLRELWWNGQRCLTLLLAVCHYLEIWCELMLYCWSTNLFKTMWIHFHNKSILKTYSWYQQFIKDCIVRWSWILSSTDGLCQYKSLMGSSLID